MNTSYCPTCGKPNIYTLEKPELCRFCNGELSFAAEIIKSSKPNKSKALKPRIIEYEEEEETDFSNLRSEDLAEIVNDGKNNKRSFSFAQVVDPNAQISVNSRISPDKPADINKVYESLKPIKRGESIEINDSSAD